MNTGTEFKPSQIVATDGVEVEIDPATVKWRISVRGYEVLSADGSWVAVDPFMLARFMRESRAWAGRQSR
jgi:hypothetical protein